MTNTKTRGTRPAARQSLVELIVQAAKESDALKEGQEERFTDRLRDLLSGPYADGQIITADYLNLLNGRLVELENVAKSIETHSDARKSSGVTRISTGKR